MRPARHGPSAPEVRGLGRLCALALASRSSRGRAVCSPHDVADFDQREAPRLSEPRARVGRCHRLWDRRLASRAQPRADGEAASARRQPLIPRRGDDIVVGQVSESLAAGIIPECFAERLDPALNRKLGLLYASARKRRGSLRRRKYSPGVLWRGMRTDREAS